MTRLVELSACLGLALVLHLAFALAFETPRGAEAAGSGGTAMVTLAPASDQIATLVESWQRPVETLQNAAMIALPPPDSASQAPLTPSIDLAPPRPELVALPDRPQTEAAPSVDLSVPEAPLPPEVVEAPEPVLPEPSPEVTDEREPPVSDFAPKTSARPVARRPENAQAQETPKPAERTQPGSSAAPAQTAAGTGGGAQAGASGGAAAKALGKAQQAKLVSVWGGQIRARVERMKSYPAGARGKGQVVLRITVARDGRITAARVGKSSGNAAFDRAALAAVKRAGRFPAAPKGLAEPSYSFNLPIRFG